MLKFLLCIASVWSLFSERVDLAMLCLMWVAVLQLEEIVNRLKAK
jgi:hypothetical protein